MCDANVLHLLDPLLWVEYGLQMNMVYLGQLWTGQEVPREHDDKTEGWHKKQSLLTSFQ